MAASIAAALLGSTVDVAFGEVGAGSDDGAAAGLLPVQPATMSRSTVPSAHTTASAEPDVFPRTRTHHLHALIEGDAPPTPAFFARTTAASTVREVRTSRSVLLETLVAVDEGKALEDALPADTDAALLAAAVQRLATIEAVRPCPGQPLGRHQLTARGRQLLQLLESLNAVMTSSQPVGRD